MYFLPTLKDELYGDDNYEKIITFVPHKSTLLQKFFLLPRMHIACNI